MFGFQGSRAHFPVTQLLELVGDRGQLALSPYPGSVAPLSAVSA